MKVFVTGATGFVGSAVVKELLDAGHQVLGLTRSDEGARTLKEAGAEVHRGDLNDLDSLRKGAEGADGIVHTAFVHDFANFEASCGTDRQVIETLGSVLLGSDRPLIVTTGTGLLAPGKISNERDEAASRSPRVASDRLVSDLAGRGLRIGLLRLPPSVHGAGDHGFVPMLIGTARQKGYSAYVGEGHNVWPAVYRPDAARVYRLALEKLASTGGAGSIGGNAGSEEDARSLFSPDGLARFHAVGEQGVPTKDIAEVIGRRLGMPVVSIAAEKAAEHFGFVGYFFALNVPSSSALTQEWLGWKPTGPGLIADIEASYF